MKMKIIVATLALTLTPALAFAQNAPNRDQPVHDHTTPVHDRTPQAHVHGTTVRH